MPGGKELDLARDRELRPIDDVDLAGQFGRDPQFLTVRRRGEAARPGSDHQVLDHRSGFGVDEMNEIADLGGDVDVASVLADQHAFGLGPRRHLVHGDVLVHVDDGERGCLFVGDVDAAPLLVDREGFGAGAGGELVDDLEGGDVDDVDHVVVATGDVELGVVGVEMHVARPSRDLEILDDLVGLGIEDDDVVGPLVADEHEPSVFRDCGRAHGRKKHGDPACHEGSSSVTSGNRVALRRGPGKLSDHRS
jgi:hypothetical protein